tara:strand:+ start:304 stop:669 length:366 start_codon:yes stop_codon:yes gene_type:complete
MTPDQFIKPLSTHYTNENYDFYVIYAPEVVKAVLSPEQLSVVLNEIELSDEFAFPKNILHEIYMEILKNAPAFLDYRIYYDVLTFENHEILWRTEYQFEKQVVIIEVNLRKQGFFNIISLQ